MTARHSVRPAGNLQIGNASVIDLRSDTVTRPSRGMRDAIANADVGDDVLDGDPTVTRLERRVADLLGKEAALFFPTGSMANQTAIWLHAAPGTELLVDVDSHIADGEMAATAALCGVQLRYVQKAGLVFTADDVRAAMRAPSKHDPDIALLSIENTHNGAGGVVTSVSDMRPIVDVAREYGVAVHLDGARIWNAAAASGEALHAFGALADTVMVSLSKGLGAPVGAALAGTATQMHRAHRIRKRFGGGMRQSGIIAAGGLYGIDHNLARLVDDHVAARDFASIVDGAGGAVVVRPDTNIVMIDLPSAIAHDVVERAERAGVRMSQWTPTRVRAVTHLDVSREQVVEAARIVAEVLSAACGTQR